MNISTYKCINALTEGIISVENNKTLDTAPIEYLFDWSDSNNMISIHNNEPHGIIITFQKPVIISKYQIQYYQNVRFMTGWDIDISNYGDSFSSIDHKNEDFCFNKVATGNGYDCAEKTTRTFSVPISSARKIKLWMSKPDPFGTYWLSPSHIDFYLSEINNICHTFIQYKLHISYSFFFFFVTSK